MSVTHASGPAQDSGFCDLTFGELYRSPLYNHSLDALAHPTHSGTVEVLHRTFLANSVALARAAINPDTARLVRRYAAGFEREMRERVARGQQHLHIEHFQGGSALFWEAKWQQQYFLAPIVRGVFNSPLLAVMARIAATDFLALPLSHMVLRGKIDRVSYHLGAHQDAVVVNPDVPYNLWIALERMVPGENSAIGFLAAPTDRVYSPDEADARMRAALDRIWLPSYLPGDVALFHNKTLHATTCYASLTRRWSVELRYMPANAIPERMNFEPFLLVKLSGGGYGAQFVNLPNDDVTGYLQQIGLERFAGRCPS